MHFGNGNVICSICRLICASDVNIYEKFHLIINDDRRYNDKSKQIEYNTYFPIFNNMDGDLSGDIALMTSNE